jgi:hypothetical protein
MPADLLPTDTLLLRLQGPQPVWESLAKRLADAPVCRALGASVVRGAWSKEAGLAYLYLELPGRIAVSHTALAPLADAAGPGAVQIARLALMCATAGASRSERPAFHYVVEMTPQAGWEVELQRWYDTEHLPGLASVPGCVHARRLWNHDAGPRSGPQSLACYDLVEAQAMGSPAWLAVRHTPWSDRMRPRFTSTVRTMFTVGR